jgi:hypothetical protein
VIESSQPSSSAGRLHLRTRFAAAVAVFALSLFVILATGRQRGDFRIDEAHKLSESYYLRLVGRGDFSNADWFRSRVERANPPFGKYLFGLAIRAAGLELPHDLVVAEQVNNGQRYPPAWAIPTYKEMLVPVRLLTAVLNAATAAAIFLIGCSAGGWTAGLAATILFGTSFMAQAFAATAVFDPLLTFSVLLTLLALIGLRKASWHYASWHMVLAGALAGVAAQVRVSGLIALAGIMAVAMVDALCRSRFRSAVVLSCLAGLACLLVATALNPYYWSSPSPSAVPPSFRATQALPARILDRYRLQFADLSYLLEREERAQTPLRGIEKPRFVAEYLFGDWSGVMMFFGLALAVAIPAATRRFDPQAAIVVTWSVVILIVLTAWLPLPYPRYVLVAVPPAALIAGYGWSILLRNISEHLRPSRRSTPAVSPAPHR